MSRLVRAAALAALTGALLDPAAAAAQATERCYGVAKAGANDGVGVAEDAGSATRDYQGDAWTMTPAGQCLTLPLPDAPDGTPRRGSYQPLERDRP